MKSLFAYAFILLSCSSMTFANKPLRGNVDNFSQNDGRSPASGYCLEKSGAWSPAPANGKCNDGSEVLKVSGQEILLSN